jgi:tetratricopeptide (TPR) repeat protein
MEPRAMDVLLALCKRANTVVSVEELLQECWGSTLHGDNPVHKTITQLRRLLGDSSTSPLYIETIRKRGYRTIADVSFPPPPVEAPAPVWQGDSPFRGLRAFDGDHAAVFFGRADATMRLRRAVNQQARAGQGLVLVLGPSGSGKTSLIHAGLLPALADGHDDDVTMLASGTLDMGELSDGQLFAGLGGALLDWQVDGAELFPGHSAHTLGEALADDVFDVIAALEAALSPTRPQPQQRLVLFLDRFEAVFAQPSITAQQRDTLIDVIDALARSPRVLVVIACRNDFYPRIAEYPALLEGKASGGHFDLNPPTYTEITQIIRLPALAANLTFGIDGASQARLDDVLCQSALTSPDALPLLQYTLNELYRLRSDSGELGFEAYHHLGGVEGAIGKRAEEVIAALPEAHRAALPRVLSLIVTISGDGDAVTSRRAPWSALASDAERGLVQALVEARLFVSELVGDEAGFGVAHEALLRRWDRVSAWVAAHRGSLQIRSRIAQLTTRWAGEGKPADLLLPQGKQLDEARGLLSMTAFSLTADELALINASTQRAVRRERLRLGVMSLILLLAVLAAVLGFTASRAKQVAQQRRAEAEGLMGFMLGDFADKLRPLGKLDLLDGISTKALEYLAVSDSGELSAASLTQRAKALQVISEVRIARGDPKAAKEALLGARAILLKQAQTNPRDKEVLKQLGTNSFWLGQVNLDQNEQVQAQDFFEQYRDYSDRVSALAPDDVDAWIEQSYAYNSLGSLALRRGDSRVAALEFKRSIDLKSKAMVHKPQDRTLAAEMADSLSWAGSANETIGELNAAMALYEQELKVVTALHEAAPGESLWANRLSFALQHRAILSSRLGAEDAALVDYYRAETLLKGIIAAEPDNRSWQGDLVRLQFAILGLVQQKKGFVVIWGPLSEFSKKIAELIRLNPKKTEWARLQAQAWQLRGEALFEFKRSGEAIRAVEESQRILQDLYNKNKADRRTRVLLADTLLTRASIESETTACKETITLLGSDAGNSNDFRVLDPWVRAHLCIAEDDVVADVRARLDRIGYRDPAYMKYLSLNHRKNL